jgi:hypothetical protein
VYPIDPTRGKSDKGYRKLRGDEVTLASGNAGGTEFRILLKRKTEEERAIVFASSMGFTRMGYYSLEDFPQNYLEQATRMLPSIHFSQILNNEPHEAIAWCTCAGDPIVDKYEFKQGFCYSIYYAAIELMNENGYNRVHLAGLNQNKYTSEEILSGIRSFIHVARRSKNQKLELVIGGRNYWELHADSYDYLYTIEGFVQDALTSEIVPVKIRNDDRNELFKIEMHPKIFFYEWYDDEVKRFNIQRRTLDMPYRLGSD